jgi:very-short-patch-repair endonuclease
MNNWNAIRSHYATYNADILKEKKSEWAIDPYAWDDGMISFTPIESDMWSFIRDHGGVFYPQYPVLNFFVDFANPKAKVAIECDGAGYHDAKKDRERDRTLAQHGWTVYRFTGSECHRETAKIGVKDLIDLHGIKRGSDV